MKQAPHILILVMLAAVAGCTGDLRVEHGECKMDALRARLQTVQDQVEFVDACMEARGYTPKGGLSDATCASELGVRHSGCYSRRNVLERFTAKFR